MRILSRFCTRFRAVAVIAAAAIALSVSLGMVGAQAGAASGTITWTGNGTNAGFCASTESLPVTVPDGQQAWLFILTSPGTGPFTISTTFSPAGDTSDAGTQEGSGNGAVHFIVMSPLGAQLMSASAMTGTDHSVLTVSGCQDGAPISSTTTTTTTTTDPSDPTTTTTTDTPSTTTTTTDTPSTTTTTTSQSDPTTTTTTGPSDPTTTTTDGASTGGNTGGNSTGGDSTPPSNVVFTPDGGTIVSTAAPTTPLNTPMSHSGLAFTGADTAAMVAVAITLIGLGSLLVLASRRRRRVA